jgi:hypothetical protein
MTNLKPTSAVVDRSLTVVQFHQLAEVPPALTWFANIDTKRRLARSSPSGFSPIQGVPRLRNSTEKRRISGTFTDESLSPKVTVTCE